MSLLVEYLLYSVSFTIRQVIVTTQWWKILFWEGMLCTFVICLYIFTLAVNFSSNSYQIVYDWSKKVKNRSKAVRTENHNQAQRQNAMKGRKCELVVKNYQNKHFSRYGSHFTSEFPANQSLLLCTILYSAVHLIQTLRDLPNLF